VIVGLILNYIVRVESSVIPLNTIVASGNAHPSLFFFFVSCPLILYCLFRFVPLFLLCVYYTNLSIRRFAYNAGFNDETAHPCDVFTRTPMLDPCMGAPTPSPAPSSSLPPTSGDGGDTSQSSAAASLCPLLQSSLGTLLLLVLAALVF
jgi:hypothetical protein